MVVRLDLNVRKRFQEIESDPANLHVEYPRHAVSTIGVKSPRFANCNGVVLLASGAVGLSHYCLDTSSPEDYLYSLISEVHQLRGDENLSAVLLGGDPDHLLQNKNILEKEGIPIIGQYCDGWRKDDQLPPAATVLRPTKGYKRLVATVSTQEVLMYGRHTGYLRLTPIKN
jgi:hypothetical protein